MNRIIKSIILPALLLAPFFALTSCNDTYNENDVVWSAFATLNSYDATSSSYTVTPTDENKTFTVTAATGLKDSSLKVGDRCYIQYINDNKDNPYISGPVQLNAVLLVANGSVKTAPLDTINGFNVARYTLANVFRTGKYLNFEILAPTQRYNGYSKFEIYADEATVSDAIPQLYVDFEIFMPGVSDNSNLGSFDISSIWDLPTCQGINLHIGARSQEFKKSNYIRPAE